MGHAKVHIYVDQYGYSIHIDSWLSLHRQRRALGQYRGIGTITYYRRLQVGIGYLVSTHVTSIEHACRLTVRNYQYCSHNVVCQNHMT